jgi:hypothetical protein
MEEESIMSLRRHAVPALTFLAFLLSGCATTTFTSSWKAPDTRPIQFAAGDEVVALVIAHSPALRGAGEANLPCRTV